MCKVMKNTLDCKFNDDFKMFLADFNLKNVINVDFLRYCNKNNIKEITLKDYKEFLEYEIVNFK